MSFQSGFAAFWSAGVIFAALLIGFAGLFWASVALERWLDEANDVGEAATPIARGERASTRASRAA